MPNVTHLQEFGNQIAVLFDDGTKQMAYPTPGGIWIIKGLATDGLYNPWAAVTISGSWASHDGYSAGGIDYPLAYGTNLVAPANGTIRISGGTGELAAGWIGSAGRRAILDLDEEFVRTIPGESTPPEGTGNLIAIVFQHLSVFPTPGAAIKGSTSVGISGASADGIDYGGDIHLHVHGVDTNGDRVDFRKFI